MDNAQNKRTDDQPISKLLRWMPLVTILIVGAVTSGQLLTTTEANTSQIKENRLQIQELGKAQSSIAAQTKRTGEDVKEIKEMILRLLQKD